MTQPSTILSTCLLQATRRAARAVTMLYEEALAPVELTASQFSTLMGVAAHDPGGVGLTPLASGLGLDRTTLTRVLAPMETRGLIEVVPDPHDARARLARLGPAGRDLLPEATRLWAGAQARALARLGPLEAGLRPGLAALSPTD
jgi:DNA-binding MarR family transcriptional regulator